VQVGLEPLLLARTERTARIMAIATVSESAFRMIVDS
jgi:hypothetical protein